METIRHDSAYKRHILELWKNPRNFGTLKSPTHELTEHNSICGDEITVQILVKDGKIKDARFSGSGCILSIVSASLLTDKLRGMKTEDAKKLRKEAIKKLLRTNIHPSRMKCALLPLEATKKALK
jgi:nitrogen fixation NifU-like protein